MINLGTQICLARSMTLGTDHGANTYSGENRPLTVLAPNTMADMNRYRSASRNLVYRDEEPNRGYYVVPPGVLLNGREHTDEVPLQYSRSAPRCSSPWSSAKRSPIEILISLRNGISIEIPC